MSQSVSIPSVFAAIIKAVRTRSFSTVTVLAIKCRHPFIAQQLFKFAQERVTTSLKISGSLVIISHEPGIRYA